MGLGVIFKLHPLFGNVEINWILEIDLLCIRFWIESLKK